MNMSISEKKMRIVIDNYFKCECNVNTSIKEAFEKGFRIGVEKGLYTNPQKVGRWIKDEKRSITFDIFVCSECGSGGALRFKFCPSCGAKMEKSAENKDIYEDYPCRKCDFAAKQSCCGCPEEKEWQEKHKNGRR